MSVSLYRRYRPQTFDEIAGQETVVDVLKKTLQMNRAGHAWLFSGPRGCGKTSAARLLAKALNCTDLKDGYEPCGQCKECISIGSGDSLDVVEIDGASNNGVDEIRELKTHVSLSPFSAKWKVYIIDEVHMLSISAFNALLKTLEEPPSFVAFILATTEPHKVPATIRSRCQHIPFQRIEIKAIVSRLEFVATKEGITFDPKAIRELARNADGALRDALSLMEQVISLGNGEISMEAVDRLLGGGTLSELEKWVASIKSEDLLPFTYLEGMFQKGASPQRVVEGVFLLFRNLWAVKRWGTSVLDSLSLSENEAEFLCSEEEAWTPEQLYEMMLYSSKLIPQVRSGLRSDVLSGLLAAKALECTTSITPRKQMPYTPPAEPDDSCKAMPLSEEGWRELERRLFARQLHIYCLLAGVTVMIEGSIAEVSFAEEDGYSFATISSERNSHSLLSEAKKLFGGDNEIVLVWRDKHLRCGEAVTEEECADVTRPEPSPPRVSFKTPESVLERDRRRPPPEGEPAATVKTAVQSGLPFENIVDEVLKWTEGEIVMVKREEGEEGTLAVPEEE